MKCFIRLVNGNPVEHPIPEESFRAAFPEINVDNLPAEFAEFIRVSPPAIDRFEKLESHTYERVGNSFTDVYRVRPMTDEEKQAFISELKANRPGQRWRWDERSLQWVPTISAMPKTGGPWKRDMTTGEFVLAPEPPFPSWHLHESGLFWEAPVPYPGGIHNWDESTQSWVPLIINI